MQGKEESPGSAQSLRLKRERPGNVKQVIKKAQLHVDIPVASGVVSAEPGPLAKNVR